jgi:hypothetical protein
MDSFRGLEPAAAADGKKTGACAGVPVWDESGGVKALRNTTREKAAGRRAPYRERSNLRLTVAMSATPSLEMRGKRKSAVRRPRE